MPDIYNWYDGWKGPSLLRQEFWKRFYCENKAHMLWRPVLPHLHWGLRRVGWSVLIRAGFVPCVMCCCSKINGFGRVCCALVPGCGGLRGLCDMDVLRRHCFLFVFEFTFGRSASSCFFFFIAVAKRYEKWNNIIRLGNTVRRRP